MLCCGLVLTHQSTHAGPQATRDTSPEALQTAIHDGADLERARKWIEAIEHYEKAVKSWPESREVEYGLRRAKIHFGLERRYTDASFQKMLSQMSRVDAMALFDDVLNRVHGNYVDPVSSTSFVAHGTESLYLALNDERFVANNIPANRKAGAPTLRKILRESFWNKPIPSRDGVTAVINEVIALSQEHAGLTPQAVIMEYLFGGCNALDDYSSFLTPARLHDLYGNIDGQFVGLGIEMKATTENGLHLVNVLPDSPASEGGLEPGDHIVGVDGKDVRTVTTEEAAGLLQGKEGSRVVVEFVRDGETAPRKVTLRRRAVQIKSIPVATIIDQRAGIGYIQMTAFQKSTVEEMDAALNKLRQQGMRSLVWDLRGNPGGLLTAAVELLDRFISNGTLVSTKGRTADQNWNYTAHRAGTWTLPLVLIIDGDSASASEIVAGAVRDHRRGTIVGRRSYGKWSVQSIFPITGDAGLRLTTAKFYSPAGHTLGKIGVAPDVEVASEKRRTHFRSAQALNVDTDDDIKAALDALKKPLVSR